MKVLKQLTLILVFGIIGQPVKANGMAAADPIVAVVNGRTVHYNELLREMGNLRWTVVEPINDHETAEDYWLTKQGDSTRIQRLYARALQALTAQKVQEQLLAAHDLWAYSDEHAMREHLKSVNARRALQQDEGVIYGPVRYDFQTFYEYQANTALIRLKELLVADGTLPVTEKALHAQYAEMKKGPYAREKYTFDAYKRQVRAAYIEETYHRWFEQQVAAAHITKQHVPDQAELYGLLHEVGPLVKGDPHAEPAKGTTYYVDGFRGNDHHDGRTSDQAWKTLEKVNTTTFRPGDRILFRRGGIWFGSLAPRGSGSANAAITIDAYGKGPKPLFHGSGVQGQGVVKLYNQSYWRLTGLEIVNPSSEEGDRRGVEVKAENAGVIRGIHLADLHVHHVRGIRGHDYASKQTGGIYFGVVDDRQKPTRFDDIRVSNCLLHHLSNQGIVTNNQRNHKDYPGTAAWQQQKFTNVHVEQNVLHHISKNALIMRLTEDGLIEHNLCYETALGMSGNTMFTISSLGTTFQFNEGFLNRSTDADGSLYDPDLASPGTKWQYSYSHDNAHGLVWFCTRKPDTGIVVRHNISSNDHGYLVYANYPFSGAKIYGNTFHIGQHRSPIIIRENPGNTHVYEFFDNRIYNDSNGTGYGFAAAENEKQHRTLRNNLYHGIEPPTAEQSPQKVDVGRYPKTNPPHGYYDVAAWFGVTRGKPATAEIKVYRNLRYGEKPGDVYARDTSSDRLLDLYLPVDGTNHKKPVILFVHGGGFGGGDKSALEKFWRDLASRGFAVISTNYRLYLKHHKTPGASATANMSKGLRTDGKFHPALQKAVRVASDDVSDVLRWIKSHAATYRMDVNRLAVSGGSAGAMTVLHLAYAAGQQVLPIKAVVNMWGGLQDASVIQAGAPPMLTFHGDQDALIHVDYAYALDKQLKSVGSLSELHVLEGKGHAIYKLINNKYLDTIVSFLRKTVKLSSSSSYQVAAEDAAWCWFADPRAVYHKGKQEKIYYSYISSRGDVVISSRDVKTKAVQTHILHEKLQRDDHNVPSILFLPDGKILTFYTEHNGRFFIRKSKHAEDISAWEAERELSFGLKDELITYSHPVMLADEGNRIYVFFRSRNKRIPTDPAYINWKQNYVYSDDLGETWTEASAYLMTEGDYNRIPYLKIVSDNRSKIHFLFTDGHPKLDLSSVYHMYYEKEAFHQTNGETIAPLTEIPLDPQHVNKVYDADQHQVKSWIWDIALDKQGYPVVTYARYPSVNDHIYHYARWNGEKWMDRKVVNAGGHITKPEKNGKVLEEHYSGGIVLDHHNPSHVFLAREVQGVFEIEQWQWKGGVWETTPITRNSRSDNIRPYVVDGYDGKEPMVLWMNGMYEHYTRYQTDLLMNERK